MAIRSRLAGSAGNSTAHAVTLPDDIVAGDRLVVGFVNDNDTTEAATTSTGWSRIGSLQQGDSTNLRLSIFTKVATGSDALTVTLTDTVNSPNQEAAWVSYCLIGNGGDALGGAAAMIDGSSATTATVEPVNNPGTGDYDSIIFLGIDNNGSPSHALSTRPSDWDNPTTPGDNTAGVVIHAVDRSVEGFSSDFSPGNFTWSGADQWVTGHVVFPAGEAATTETHKFYLTNAPTPVVPGIRTNGFDGAHEDSIATPFRLGPAPQGASAERHASELSDTSGYGVMLAQFVSEPATADGTVTGPYTLGIGRAGDTAGQMRTRWVFWAMTPDGDLRTGTIYNGSSFATETPAGYRLSDDVGDMEFLAGDRLVVEVGFSAINTSEDPYEGTVYYGGTGSTDIAHNDADVSRPKFLEFRTTPGVTFERPPSAPGAVFDLSNWKITLPTEDPNDPGDALEIRQPELDTYFDEHFYLDADDQMVMRAPTSGDVATTGGSDGVRAEFREMENGEEAGWDLATTAPRRLTVTGVFDPTSITDGTQPRQEEIVGQIHGPSGTPPLYLSVEFTTGAEGNPTTPHLRVYKDGPGVDPNPLSPLTATSEITYRIDIARDDTDGENHVKVYAAIGTVDDLPTEPQFDWAASEFTEDTSECYLKAGPYNKTTVESGSSGEAKATITHLELIQAETRRFYLANRPSTTPDVSVAEWINDGAGADDQHLLTEEPTGVPASFARPETTSTTPWYVLLGRWVSTPVATAGTVYTDWHAAAALLSSPSGAELQPLVIVFATVGETDERRGTAISVEVDYTIPTVDASEFWAGPGSGADLTMQVGDRLIVDVGYVSRNKVTTSRTGTLHYGGTASPDLAATDTDFDRPAWIDLTMSPGLAFEPPPADETVTGQLTTSLGIPTAAATASITAAGGLAGALPAPEAEIAGIATASGALDGTLPGAAAALFGTVAASGSLSTSLALPAGDVTGTVVVSGGLAGGVPAPTVELAAVVRGEGSLAGTLPAAAASVSGGVTAEGTLSGGLPTAEASLTGAVQAAGALVAELPMPTASVASAAPGGLAGALPMPTSTVAGSVKATGVLDGALPLPRAFIGAGGLVTGAVGASLPMPGGEFAAQVTAQGALSASLPVPAADLGSAVSGAGALAAALPAVLAALSGGVTAPGSLAGSLPTPLAELAAADARARLAAVLAMPSADLVATLTAGGVLATALHLPTAAIRSTDEDEPGPVLHAGPPIQLPGKRAGLPTQPAGLRAGEPTKLGAGS